MSLNYKEIHYLIDYAKELLSGSIINKVTKLSNKQLYLNIRKSGKNLNLIFNIDNKFTFFGEGKPLIPAPPNPYNFTQSLRKHIIGKRIKNIIKIENERIFIFEIRIHLV